MVVVPWRGRGPLIVRSTFVILSLGLDAGCYVDQLAGERVSDGSSATTVVVASSSGVADDSGTTTTAPTITATATDATTTAPATCDAPSGHSVCDDGLDPFAAIGLGCPGTPFDSTALVASSFTSPDETAWRLARELGNAFWTPREGSQLLVLSTGTLPLADASGRITLPSGQTNAADGNNGNPDAAALPEPLRATPGSNDGAGGAPFSACDGVGDCSDTLPSLLAAGGPPNDMLALSFRVVVPDDTHGWQVELAWLSAELPSRVGAPANDAFVWWVSSEAYVGNIATDAGAPMTATGLRPRVLERDFVGDAPALIDTGFGGTTAQPCAFDWAAWDSCPRGGASGWLTLDGPANPGETLELTAVLFDHGDTELDTMVLVDDWRWRCEGCTPGRDCGLSPAAR